MPSRDVRSMLLEAALAVLTDEGLDAVTLPRLAAKAGISTGPVYNRWDGGEDVVLELWNVGLRAHLDRLIAVIDDAMSPDDERSGPAMTTLVDEVATPSGATLALTEVLLVFRRFPWLNASIAVDVDAVLTAYLTEGHDTDPSYRLGQLNVILGTLCLGRIVEDLPIDWRLAFESVRRTFNGPFDASADPAAERHDPSFVFFLPLPQVTTGDDIVDAYFGACCSVMSRAGYAKASAHRLSRETGLTFSHVYKHFDTKEDLTQAAVGRVLTDFLYRAVRSLNVHDRGEYVANVMGVMRGLWHERSLPSARLRCEMTVAARHVPALSTALQEGMVDAWSTTLDPLPDGTSPGAAHMNLSIAIYGLGLSLLALACPGARTIDMLPLVCAWATGMDTIRNELGIPLPGRPGETTTEDTP